MQELIKQLHVSKGTTSQLTDLKTGLPISKVLRYLEREFPDSSFFFDVDIESLIQDLYYNGFTNNQILEYHKARYGNIILFYYYTDLELYVMEVGVN